MEPNKSAIRAWVNALRSGEYLQGREALRENPVTPEGKPRYCCLGVAVEVYNKLHPEMSRRLPVSRDGAGYVVNPDVCGVCEGCLEDTETAVLPRPVWEWLGLSDNPHVGRSDTSERYYVSAISANDDEDWDFTKIANGIEELYLSDDDRG